MAAIGRPDLPDPVLCKANHVEHKAMLLRSMASRKVRLVWRSVVERFCQHRYIVVTWRAVFTFRGLVFQHFAKHLSSSRSRQISWTRRVPLLYLPDGAEEFEALRAPGANHTTIKTTIQQT